MTDTRLFKYAVCGVAGLDCARNTDAVFTIFAPVLMRDFVYIRAALVQTLPADKYHSYSIKVSVEL